MELAELRGGGVRQLGEPGQELGGSRGAASRTKAGVRGARGGATGAPGPRDSARRVSCARR